MLDPDDERGWAVVTRLLDFFGDRTAWHRRLWAVGSVTRLHEVFEAVEAFDGVAAARHSLSDARHSARGAIRRDPGVASRAERGRIAGLLSDQIVAGSAAHEQIAEIATSSAHGYLLRWAAAIRDGQALPGPESIARYVASYLLDGGSSGGHLYRWFTRFAFYDDAHTLSLADLLELADEKIVQRCETYEVLVPFESVLGDDKRPAGWLGRTDALAWLSDNAFADTGSYVGGLRRTFEVRDAGAAAEAIAAILDAYRGRVTAAYDGDRWRPCPVAYVAGARDPIPLSPGRRANVPVLAREDKLFSEARDDRLDSALQLVSFLEDSPAPAAVAGAWAGVESLLKAPGDGGAHEGGPENRSPCRMLLLPLGTHDPRMEARRRPGGAIDTRDDSHARVQPRTGTVGRRHDHGQRVRP